MINTHGLDVDKTLVKHLMNIGIIGSAGKKGAIRKVKPDNYQAMINNAMNDVKRLSLQNLQSVTLISGGAPLSDHIAVELFLKDIVLGLTLHFPCKWDEKKCKFYDTGTTNYATNPGGLLNQLHREFSQQLKKNSLQEIQLAIDKGAKVVVGTTFWDRNLKIANESHALIAFTFEDDMTPGTKHTWNACKIDSRWKVHHLISLRVSLSGEKIAGPPSRSGSVGNLRHTIN